MLGNWFWTERIGRRTALVSAAHVAPAQLPPRGLSGLDTSWSRLVDAPDHSGKTRTWHLLDTSVEQARLTLLCVHGNPSWSYLWRKVVQQAPPDVRVIAVDQLDMGFSERTGTVRRLQNRIDDLVALTDRLEICGPVITVAHDWGGPVSLGWAQRHLDLLSGIVLTNTAVHQPASSPAPTVIRATRTPGMLRSLTVNSTAFIQGALAMSRPLLPRDVRDGFVAPYRSAARREAIATFVEDIPLDQNHPSFDSLATVAAGLDRLADVPALLLWGPSDPVFSDLYLHDLEQRLPHVDVHRFVGAGHFVAEDADVAGALLGWIEKPLENEPMSRTDRPSLWHHIERLSDSDTDAVVELHDGDLASISFGDLNSRVKALSAGLVDSGVRRGDRVALMVPPGIELTTMLYACWRMGAAVVLVDSGLGPRNMSRAIASAAPDHLIGIDKALAAASAMRWPGRRISVGPLSATKRRALGVTATLPEIEQGGALLPLPRPPDDDDVAAVVFTSGSTGPSKGVIYRHHQLQAQRDQLIELYDITENDTLVAAFAPFALYGPALGITSAVPNMDLTRPGTLSAVALADAVSAVGASLVFASPAALANVAATKTKLASQHKSDLSRVRLLLSAGAPINAEVLSQMAQVLPNAEPHTPYGMTEILPVADISLTELRAAGSGDGVCVGKPRGGVKVRISEVDSLGLASEASVTTPHVMGEIIVSGPHAKDSYDRLWFTQHKSAQPHGWHRSGDVGYLDDDGRLWVGGRLEHVLTTGSGPVMPVALEQAAESVAVVERAAVVGVGPAGSQAVVVVVESSTSIGRRPLATPAVADQVRDAIGKVSSADIAAVLATKALPTDRRHNAKIGRAEVATWASSILAGDRVTRL